MHHHTDFLPRPVTVMPWLGVLRSNLIISLFCYVSDTLEWKAPVLQVRKGIQMIFSYYFMSTKFAASHLEISGVMTQCFCEEMRQTVFFFVCFFVVKTASSLKYSTLQTSKKGFVNNVIQMTWLVTRCLIWIYTGHLSVL